jgi:hypothetical protein
MKAWRICLLGAIDGLVFVGMARMVQLCFDYVERTATRESYFDGGLYLNVASLQEKWLGATLLIVCMFILASYFGSRYWRTGQRYHIVGWIVIGIIAVMAWNLSTLALGLWDFRASGQAFVIESITSPRNPLHGPVSLGLVVIVNLIYGSIIGLLSNKPQSNKLRH